ncbi:bifunctional DedA family/phosphatase PAP2 family protein [Taklimakanibacter deserti]|uniref:bifunctional DedA family/phosphatase PAP2 family protein n=1 Tax=Taklimakanibacter deserti TaxID=2267839 RepID=UPI0013C43333
MDYFAQHPGWAIAVVFLIAFGEALLIIGLFVPSTAVLVGAGMLVGTGHLEFWPVFIATAVGAILGDQLSYWAGRLFGNSLKTLWPLNRYPVLVARGEDFVRRHGGKSIAIGRFVPGVKAVVPGIVGMFGMGQVYFATINVTSGLFWTAAHVLPGMLFGQVLAMAGELSERLLIVLLLLLLLLAIAGWLIRLFIGGLGPIIENAQDSFAAWAQKQPGRFWPRIGAVISPAHPGSLSIILFAALAVTAFIAFLHIMSSVFGQSTLIDADLSVHNMMQGLRNAPSDEIMTIITMLGDGFVMVAVGLAIVAWLLWRREWRIAVAAFLTILAARLFVPLMKLWLQRPRPLELSGLPEVFSFPSGHTTFATVTLGVFAVLASHGLRSWGKAVVFAAAGIAVIAIAYSRIYLGAHWMSDVLGGFLFGAVMIAAFGIAIEAVPSRRIIPWGLTVATLLAFAVAGSIHISRDYPANAETYAPREAIVLYDREQWESGSWASLPRQRIDLAGRSEEPFCVQWAGDPTPLAEALGKEGWTEEGKWSWTLGLAYLDPQRALSDLAPRPALHQGRLADLTWTKPVAGKPDERLVLRAWKTDVMIGKAQETYPVYLMSLMRERLRRGFHLYAVPSPLPADAPEREGLAALIRSIPAVRVVEARGLEAKDGLTLVDAMK